MSLASIEKGKASMPSWQSRTQETAGKSTRDLSFLSKNWLKAQKEVTELDFNLMNQAVQSFTAPFNDLASSFNREWDNFRKSSVTLHNFQTLESPLFKLKDIQSPAGSQSPFSSSSEEIASWKPLPLARREPASHVSVRKAVVAKAVAKESYLDANRHCKDIASKPVQNEVNSCFDCKEVKEALQDWQNSQKGKGKQRFSLEEWEPLRRLRVSLMELESMAAVSRSPTDFFENLKKMEFFENTKKTLSLSMMAPTAENGHVGDGIAPLDVPELLESLVRQSEPLLNQLGVKKGFQDKICSTIRSWKHGNLIGCGFENDLVMLSKEAGRAANELDLRIANVLDSTGYKHREQFWGGHAVFGESETESKRSITIATTASLPWMTGTAINPLLRAAYLAKDGEKKVTLLIPWLSRKDQLLVYPNQMTFDSPHDQEKYIREWLDSRISFHANFKIIFYPGKYAEKRRSILAVDDITEFIPKREADIAILEEPEHLTWYHHGARWTQKFQHVVGIVHTNYLEYAKREKNGPVQAFLLKYINNWVTSIYCHKVIRLSSATQNLPKSVICNVHGVSPQFIQIGQTVAAEKERGNEVFTHNAYFLGKMVWGKGYRELLDLWALHKEELSEVHLDVFGTGEDSSAVKQEACVAGLQMKFHQGRDHADELLRGYKVFINPSVSDVVCTTTAEALAMGKIVVCADHPSNEFFKDFPNCYMYRSSGEFVEKVKQAINSQPLPLTLEQQHMLSWEAATERFLKVSELDRLLKSNKMMKDGRCDPRKRRSLGVSVLTMGDVVDYGMFLAHYCLSGIEIARLASGAIPGTLHMDEEQQKDLGLV